jgi:hypothetical protein
VVSLNIGFNLPLLVGEASVRAKISAGLATAT